MPYRPVPAMAARSLARTGSALALLLAGACSETTFPEVIRSFDRPTAIAFSCYGQMRVTEGQAPTLEQPVVYSPMPAAACGQWVGGTPAGQEPLMQDGSEVESGPGKPAVYGFVLQPEKGSVALIYYPLELPAGGQIRVSDADGLIRGTNSIPMGSRPVGIAPDVSGCYMMTANAGSCDLSVLDVDTALNVATRPVIRRMAITNAAGEPIGARPGAMAGDPRSAPVGFECPDAPEGQIYIAYPECNMVAAVDASTGVVSAGIVFRDDGTVEITDGNVGCAATCGGAADPAMSQLPDAGVADGGMSPATGAMRPATVTIGPDRRLYIGAADSSRITIVALDDSYAPVAVEPPVQLEGDVGVLSLAVSDLVNYGAGGQHRFVYAVATDGTVRVADVHQRALECETQADTRFLHDQRNLSFLPCMPVGGPMTPARRVGSRSPGIHFPGSALPTSVAFAPVDHADQPADDKLVMHGYFAFITLSTGQVSVVDIRDEDYSTIEESPVDPNNSVTSDIALALPHKLRDIGFKRDTRWTDGCSSPSDSRSYRPRVESGIQSTFVDSIISGEKAHLLPAVRRVRVSCAGTDDTTRDIPVPELAITAGEEVRRQSFPDLASVPTDEVWTLIWEGPLSLDTTDRAIDGPPVRTGYVEGGSELLDPGGPFCRMGAEPYDILILTGCDPALGNAQCGAGEVCYVHPETTPASITTGACLPAERANELGATCRDLLVSRRRYSVQDVYRDKLVIGERRRVLRTTPLEGCADDDQCNVFYDVELDMQPSDSPRPAVKPKWACEPDPSRAPGPRRCVMTCSDSECEEGFACSQDHRCVEAPLPPDVCTQTLQSYQVRAGDAFSVLGSRSGYLHHRIEDPATGRCIEDESGNPLAVGRLPLTAPACEGDALTDVTPNPCMTTVEHTETVIEGDVDGVCQRIEDESEIHTRTTDALRFRNPVFTMHLVDPVTRCIGDREGTGSAYPTVHPGFQITFRVVGGLAAFITGLQAQTQTQGIRRLAFPAAITRGPLGNMWIMDQGDRSASILGQVLYFNPNTSHVVQGEFAVFFGVDPSHYLQ